MTTLLWFSSPVRYSDYGAWSYAVKDSEFNGDFSWEDLFDDWEFVGSVVTWRQPGDSFYRDDYVGVKIITMVFNTLGTVLRSYFSVLFIFPSYASHGNLVDATEWCVTNRNAQLTSHLYVWKKEPG